MPVRFLPLALLVALAVPASAQASFTGLYVQSFDDIGGAPNAELPEGWRVQTLPGIRALGDFADASTTTDAHGGNLFGQSAPTGAINFGSGPEATATERAIGFSSNGDIGTGLLYFHFRVDLFGSFDEIWYAKSEETYRGGQDEAESQTEAFYSYDGSTWYALFGQGRTSGGDRDGYADAPSTGGSSGAGRVDLPTPLQQGDELYLAFRYSAAPGWSTGQVPAEAFDDFVIGTSFAGLRHIFVGRGERVFGDVPVGETAGPLTVDYNPVGYSGEDPVVEITGSAAADFSVELNAPFNEADVFFTPSEPGLREALLRFRIGSMVSREVALRGGSGEPAGGSPAEVRTFIRRVQGEGPIPADGDNYRYKFFAEVSDVVDREVDVWSDLLLPDGSVVVLHEPETVTLTPGERWKTKGSQTVPFEWPHGTYTHRLYWGRYPDRIDAQASLSFRKLAGLLPARAYRQADGPNPFRSQTAVRFDDLDGGFVRAELFDAVGRRVQVLHEGAVPDGAPLTVTVDGRDLPAGLYVVRLVGEEHVAARTVVRAR